MLSRNTKWRQGSVLTDDDALALKLVESLASGKRAVVISHDCDLPHEDEKFVEVIVGTVTKPDQMLAGARNPRRLHLSFSTPDSGEQTWVELCHADRRLVNKPIFAELKKADHRFVLSADEKRVLKFWLAIRYGRQAFPTAFENRLRKEINGKTIVKHIEKIIRPVSPYLIGLFFDLHEEIAGELPEGVPYNLSISVVYDANEGGESAMNGAKQTADKIKKLFLDAYGPAQSAKEIALEGCSAVADTHMTLADLRRVDQWRLEYISLNENPISDFLAAGKLPA